MQSSTTRIGAIPAVLIALACGAESPGPVPCRIDGECVSGRCGLDGVCVAVSRDAGVRDGGATVDGPNVRVLIATSYELFSRLPEEERHALLPWAQWQDSMVVSSSARRLMSDWIPHRVAEEYALTSDWDDRWRTGGSVPEITAEAHLDPDSIRTGIERFVGDREQRRARIREV